MENINDKLLAKFQEKRNDERRRLDALKEKEALLEKERVAELQTIADGVMEQVNKNAKEMSELLRRHDFPLEIGKAALFSAIVNEGEELATWELLDDEAKPTGKYVTYDGNVLMHMGSVGENFEDGVESVIWKPYYEPPNTTMSGSTYDRRDIDKLHEFNSRILKVIDTLDNQDE